MLRSIVAMVMLATSTPLWAQGGVQVESDVFVEHSSAQGLLVEPSDRFAVGDRVVTVMSWQAPASGRFTIVTTVPRRLDLQSVSRQALEYSTDGARSWHALSDARELPHGVTHLRWRTAGDGRLTYRAIVREP